MLSELREGSVVLACIREAKLKCLLAAEHSRLWSLLLWLFNRDRWHTVFARQSTRLKCLVESSATHRLYDTSAQQLTTAANTAAITSVVLFWYRAVRSSALYRWVTTEPDLDVIVIDLRETWTVGPVIRGIDRLWSLSLTATPDSVVMRRAQSTALLFRDRPIRVVSLTSLFVIGGVVLVSAILGDLTVQTLGVVVGCILLAVAGLRSDTSLAELRETRAATLLIAAFEPPEPREPSTDSEQRAVDTKTNEDSRSNNSK